jgi:hypothetical protein
MVFNFDLIYLLKNLLKLKKKKLMHIWSNPGQRCTAGTGGIRCISDALHWNAPETHRKIEAVFQPELSRIFSR